MKTGLQISFEKIKFMINIKMAPKIMNMDREKVVKVKSLKYCGQMMQYNG